jgi:hypothetical protein
MADNASPDDKKARRKKQIKKMTKIVAKAWGYPKAEPFQESSRSSNGDAVFDLSSVGQNIDNGVYQLGRHGWEHFSRDVGGIYNHHIQRYDAYDFFP